MIHQRLRDFQTLAGPDADRWLFRHDGGQHTLELVFGVLLHGDEVGPIDAALALIRGLADGSERYGGRLTIFVGNPEAARAGRRFLEADLNRVFLDDAPPSLEQRRARALMPLLDACDLFIDFHQTAGLSLEPFWTLPWSTPAWRWIRIAGDGHLWTTRAPGLTFASGTCCGDEYARHQGTPGLTLEVGPKGFSDEATAITLACMRRALAAADALAGGASLEALAEGRPEPRFLLTAHKEPFGDSRRALTPGLANFMPVRAGQRLSPEGAPEVVSPVSGLLLFPKYPPRGPDGAALPPAPTDLFHVLQDAPEHPLALFGDAPVQ
jgi:succinylglutamate desuccinylase